MIITPNDSISDAANSLNPGQTLRLRGGSYSEQIRITASGQQDAPITIAPYEAEPVTWIADDDPLNVDGSYIRIRGIEFDREAARRHPLQPGPGRRHLRRLDGGFTNW